MQRQLVWGAKNRPGDPPKYDKARATSDAKVIMEFINQYNLLDTVTQLELKTVLGQQIGFDTALVAVVIAALSALPAVNPGPMTPEGMAEQAESIDALNIVRVAVQKLDGALGNTIALRKAYLWQQTSDGASAVAAAAAQQQNRVDRDPTLLETAQQVADAMQKALARKQATADGKARAADAVEKEMQARIDALTAQNQQFAVKLAAAEKALADTKGNAVTGDGSAAPAPAPHTKKGGHVKPQNPTISIPVTTPSSQRQIPR